MYDVYIWQLANNTSVKTIIFVVLNTNSILTFIMDVEQKTVDLSMNIEPEMGNVALEIDAKIQYDPDKNMNCALEDRICISENPENVPDTKKFKCEGIVFIWNSTCD